MPTKHLLFRSDFQNDRPVQFEGYHSCAARCRQAEDTYAIPGEMIAPILGPGIEDRHVVARLEIRHCQSCSLPERARNTCEGQVAFGGLASCHNRDNMVNVKRSDLTSLRQSAIFAAADGSLYYELAQ